MAKLPCPSCTYCQPKPFWDPRHGDVQGLRARNRDVGAGIRLQLEGLSSSPGRSCSPLQGQR